MVLKVHESANVGFRMLNTASVFFMGLYAGGITFSALAPVLETPAGAATSLFLAAILASAVVSTICFKKWWPRYCVETSKTMVVISSAVLCAPVIVLFGLFCVSFFLKHPFFRLS